MQTFCSISMTHVTTSPDFTNMGLRLERLPAEAGRRGSGRERANSGRRGHAG